MYRNLSFFTIAVILFSCESAECPFETLNYRVLNESDQAEIVTINAAACSAESADVIENPNYFTKVYFKEVAESQGEEPYFSFEKGEEKTNPIEVVTQSLDHIIEVRNLNDHTNNLNNPYPISAEDFELTGNDGETKSGEAKVEVNGHPLQLILALNGVNDAGGAKKWKYASAKDAETNEDIPLEDTDWACFFDNEYSFMKGERFKYDPKGTLCTKEKPNFPDEKPITVYGKYRIEMNVIDTPVVVLSIIESDNSEREETIEILNWSIENYNEITVKTSHPDGREAIAIMRVSETVEWSEF